MPSASSFLKSRRAVKGRINHYLVTDNIELQIVTTNRASKTCQWRFTGYCATVLGGGACKERLSIETPVSSAQSQSPV